MGYKNNIIGGTVCHLNVTFLCDLSLRWNSFSECPSSSSCRNLTGTLLGSTVRTFCSSLGIALVALTSSASEWTSATTWSFSTFGSCSSKLVRIEGLLSGRELCADEDTDCSFPVFPLNIREGEMDSITSISFPRSTKSSSSSIEAWRCRRKLGRRMVSSPFLIRTNRPDSGISSPPEVRKGMNLTPGQTERQT